MKLLKLWNHGEVVFQIETSTGRELSFKIFKGELYNYDGNTIQSKPFKQALKTFICSEGMKYLKSEADKAMAEIKKLEARKKVIVDSLFYNTAMRDIEASLRMLRLRGRGLRESWDVLKSLKEAV